MLLITGFGVTGETGFPKPLGRRTVPYSPKGIGLCSLQGRGDHGEVSSLGWKSAGQARGRIRPDAHPRLCWRVADRGSDPPWSQHSGGRGGPGWGCVRNDCVCLAGSVHHACLIESLGRQQTGSMLKSLHLAWPPRPRGAHRNHKDLSHLAVRPQAGGGWRALPRTGGSDAAGAFSLLVPSCLCFSLCLL